MANGEVFPYLSAPSRHPTTRSAKARHSCPLVLPGKTQDHPRNRHDVIQQTASNKAAVADCFATCPRVLPGKKPRTTLGRHVACIIASSHALACCLERTQDHPGASCSEQVVVIATCPRVLPGRKPRTTLGRHAAFMIAVPYALACCLERTQDHPGASCSK